MKKRVFAVIMAMALVTSVFTGCGKEAGESQSTAPVVEDQVEQNDNNFDGIINLPLTSRECSYSPINN